MKVLSPRSSSSKVATISPFYQHDWRFNDQWSLLFGGRVDIDNIDYHMDWVNTIIGPQHLASKITVGLPNYNASLNYKVTPATTLYATYNWSQNPVGATGNGGGFTTGGNANFANAALRHEADEGGHDREGGQVTVGGGDHQQGLEFREQWELHRQREPGGHGRDPEPPAAKRTHHQHREGLHGHRYRPHRDLDPGGGGQEGDAQQHHDGFQSQGPTGEPQRHIRLGGGDRVLDAHIIIFSMHNGWLKPSSVILRVSSRRRPP